MQVLEIVRPSSPTEDFRGQYGELNCYSSIRGAIEAEASNDSVHLFFPDVLQDKAAEFLTGFRGRSMYAVKANPHAEVLKTLYTAGVRDFDVASIREVELVAGLLPGAKLYFMHPIKSRQAIQRAYMMGVRAFAFDHMDELNKILEETGYAEDLELFLRLGVSAKGAAYELSGKFGAPLDMAPMLLSRARQVAMKLGVSFHVGSQCMRPGAFSEAILQAAAVVGHAGIKLDVIDVGGGFPVAYPGMEPPALDSYFQTIHSALDMHGFADAETLCEPVHVERAVDGLEIAVERRWFHARISHREAAAHVDHVQLDASVANYGRRLQNGFGESARAHALAAHMEADTQLHSDLTGTAEQHWRHIKRRAELAGKLISRTFGGHAKTQEQLQIFGIAGFLENLVQLIHMVEREGTHTHHIGALDGLAALDRVHEVKLRARQQAGHQLNLADGGDIEIAHASSIQRFQHFRVRVGFHRIHGAAAESGQELGCLVLENIREEQVHAVVRGLSFDCATDGGVAIQFAILSAKIFGWGRWAYNFQYLHWPGFLHSRGKKHMTPGIRIRGS